MNSRRLPSGLLALLAVGGLRFGPLSGELCSLVQRRSDTPQSLHNRCPCGRVISANKEQCLACSREDGHAT